MTPLSGDGDREGFVIPGRQTEADGAPIPKPSGGFITDSRGEIVIAKLAERALEEIASEGGGRPEPPGRGGLVMEPPA